jgi:hypothetical protein
MMGVAPVSMILPPKHKRGDTESVTMRFPRAMLKRVQVIADRSGHSRTEVVLHLLAWALDEYDREQGEQRKKG